MIVHRNPLYLEEILKLIGTFLATELHLDLHPSKVEIRKFGRGIDFLGYVILPHYIIPRTKTKRRMIKKLLKRQDQLVKGMIDEKSYDQTLQSYLGILRHCNAYDLQNVIENNFL